MKYSVYTLADPRDGAIRYVGITNNIETRYYTHCLGSDSTSRPWKWLMKLREHGLKPLLDVVEEVEGQDAAYLRETYWLNFFLAEEEPLLNWVPPKRRRFTQSEIDAFLKRQQEKQEDHVA